MTMLTYVERRISRIGPFIPTESKSEELLLGRKVADDVEYHRKSLIGGYGGDRRETQSEHTADSD